MVCRRFPGPSLDEEVDLLKPGKVAERDLEVTEPEEAKSDLNE